MWARARRLIANGADWVLVLQAAGALDDPGDPAYWIAYRRIGGCELMHVVHPHLPHAVPVTLAAALATLAIMLALAARLGDVQLSQNQPSTPAITHAAPQLSARLTAPAAPRPPVRLTNPFTPLVPDPIAPRWTPAHRVR